MEQVMKEKILHSMNISLPNLMNICVDDAAEGEISGRLYHCYAQEPVLFRNVIELLMEAESLFDRIGYPQASTRSRSFGDSEPAMRKTAVQKVVSQKDIIQYTGKLATLVTGVRFRQNSTWQGEFVRGETGECFQFLNTLSFVRLIDQEVNAGES